MFPGKLAFTEDRRALARINKIYYNDFFYPFLNIGFDRKMKLFHFSPNHQQKLKCIIPLWQLIFKTKLFF